MRRFWKQADVLAEDGVWGVALDGKPVRTPARKPLLVPTRRLAEAIAEEWNACGDRVKPGDMRLTGIANAAIDHVAANRSQFAAALAQYAESDLTCYRAEGPPALAERRQTRWDKLLGWARRRFDIDFRTTTGLVHVPQPEPAVLQLSQAVAALDSFRLAGLSPLVTIGGSLVAALALLDESITAEQAWEAVTVDECWQLETWGSDTEAEAALEARRRDFFAAARFLELLAN